jgi:hypothetical protein
MDMGPCLSPISLALQYFHKPRKAHAEKFKGDGTVVNPMLSRRMAYSPPLSRRLKRTRALFVEDETDTDADDLIFEMNDASLHEVEDAPSDFKPASKKQKVDNAIPLAMGRHVRARFHSNITVPVTVVLLEKFAVLISVNEEIPELPEVCLLSKHWARWRGESLDGVPLLDIVHSAE